MFRYAVSLPPLVQRAVNLAEQMGTPVHCSRETGRLLSLLASHLQSGVIGQIDSGSGTATAWLISSLSPGVTLVTVEEDPAQAAAARALYDSLLNVRIFQGDWRQILNTSRFSLLYVGRSPARSQEPEALIQCLQPGALIVIDGLTPQEKVPLEYQHQPDPLREFWLGDPRLISCEMSVSPSEALILASRRG
jgi:predicted O-methyltransferase YrrM